MSKRVFRGKTVKSAVSKGLLELGLTESEVRITVLEQPSKGIFGLFGAKDAMVELEPLPKVATASVALSPANDELGAEVPGDVPDVVAATKAYLSDIIREMGLRAQVEQSEDEDGNIVLHAVGKDLGMFIGRRGQTLDALQLLVNVYANRMSEEHIRIVVDAERFRERRRKTLQDLSLRLANQVVRTKKEVALEPMSSIERRVIHSQLQHHPKVKTYSKGEEPNRRIVIALK
ncbi:protein jag [Paenibacillus sp. TRM 82003]|nr:protein jag [Paenibacillus sp. TRM 82003]